VQHKAFLSLSHFSFKVPINPSLLPFHPIFIFTFKSVCMHGNGSGIEKEWQGGWGRKG
jgi:hypothetical protein